MKICVLVHRGICNSVNNNIENSHDSLKEIKKFSNKKIKYGIEFDIQQIKTGELVCHHDETLERIYGDKRKVCDLTLQNVKDIPSLILLIDILDNFKDSDYTLNIEIKSYNLDNVKKRSLCLSILNTLNDYDITNYVITSFDIEIVKILLKNSRISASVYLIIYKDNDISEETLDELINQGMCGIVVSKELLILKGIDYYISKKIDLMIYTFYKTGELDSISDNLLIQIKKSVNLCNSISVITDNIYQCNKIINS